MTRFLPTGTRPGIPWRCIYSKPGRETEAEREIVKQGFAAWTPLEIVRWADRTTHIRPLLTRYLFAQFDVRADAWGSIRDTRGVSAILCDAGGLPLVVPDAAISLLIDDCAPNGIVQLPEERQVRREDVVRVLDGPWRQFSGVVCLTTKQRVEVMMTIFGRPSSVSFRREQVELVA
jgi:transcription antitermination factor NusG